MCQILCLTDDTKVDRGFLLLWVTGYQAILVSFKDIIIWLMSS